MRRTEPVVFNFLVLGIFLLLGLLYLITPYTEYTAVAVNEDILSEEFLTVKIHDTKRIDYFNLTEVRYINSYSILGSPNFMTIQLITDKTIYPDDKIILKKTVVKTLCDYYEKVDDKLVYYNQTLGLVHSFGIKVDFKGDSCGKNTFYRLVDEAEYQNKRSDDTVSKN